MASPFHQTLYAYLCLSEIKSREAQLQDLRDINLASYFRIAQSKDGGKALQKLFNKQLKTLQPTTSADLDKSLEVARQFLNKQKSQ